MSLLDYIVRNAEADRESATKRARESWRREYERVGRATGLSAAEVQRRHRAGEPIEAGAKPVKQPPRPAPTKRPNTPSRSVPTRPAIPTRNVEPRLPSQPAPLPGLTTQAKPKLTEAQWANLVIQQAALMRCSVAELLEQTRTSTAGVRDIDAAHKLALAQAAHTGQSYRDAFVQLFGTRYPLR